jgi:hypothetical protein
MNHPNPEQLLKDLLSGDGLSDFRSTSLEYGLASLRLRRRRRRLVSIALMSTVPLVAVIVFFSQSIEHALHPPASVPPRLVASSAKKLAPTLSIIDDEQLLALFSDQPVALVGNPGQQQLVLLNEFQSELKQ